MDDRVHRNVTFDPVMRALFPLWQYYKYMLPVDGGYEYAPAVVVAMVRLLQPILEEVEDEQVEAARDAYGEGYDSGYEAGREAE